MSKIPFIVSARAGKLMGRENFSNPDGAIIELVKNSYDADAKQCIVVFDIPTYCKSKIDEIEHFSPIKKESIIYIIDNGEGMTKKVIEDHWMKIGTGIKEKEYLSDENRVKTGAKGIGRFALDRLGFETEMWTLSKKAKGNVGAFWKMDWQQFDNSDKPITQVLADLEIKEINIRKQIGLISENESFNKLINSLEFDKGTILKISNLKDEWFDQDITNVFKNLSALIPPKELNIPFEVFLFHSQRPKEYGIVETAFFNDYDYKIDAKYNAKTLNVDFELTRNELDIKEVKKKFDQVFLNTKKPFDLVTIENKTFKYTKSIDKILKWNLNASNRKSLKDVGSFELTFYYLKLTNSLKEGYPYKKINTTERRSILDRFGGVKIYRDSFRVRPYGDPNNDWLKLGARVAQSPASAGQRIGDWRVRPEQTAGIITISRKENPLLIDKSDRGALQENDAFETLKKIIIGVIHEFEFDRSKILNPFYLFNKELKEKAREQEIQKRAEILAEEIVANRKKVEEQIYGKRFEVDLFHQKQEEEEKKSYQKTFKDTFVAIEEQHAQKENEDVVMVRALASLGLVMSSFAHELKSIKNKSSEIYSLKKIFYQLVTEETRKKYPQLYNDSIDIFDLLSDNTERIIHWIDYTLTTIRKDKRKRGKLNVNDFFVSLNKTWKNVFKEKGIVLNVEDKTIDVEYDFRAFEMDMITIFSNLINNSIDSFERQKIINDREIFIQVKHIEQGIEIVYSDNGVGLDEIFSEKDDIFLPFTTSKKDRKGNDIGTGLGMYLVKEVITDYAGDIEILDVDEGFALKILLPTRKN